MTPPSPDYCTIPLTQGQVAIVDANDYPSLSQYKWFAQYDAKTKGFYVGRMVTVGKKKQHFVSMHRMIMDFPPCKVDHIDRNGLNNRRSNLRRATNSQNGMNRTMQKNNTSGFKGVSFHKVTRKYQVTIRVAGKIHALGYFHDPAQAAKAYDRAARSLFGEFARLNFADG